MKSILKVLLAISALILLVALPILLEALGLEGRALRAELAFLSMLFVWGIFALSYNLLFGITGLFSLAHALFLGIGALAVGIATSRWDLGIWEALGLGLLSGAVLSALIGAVVVQVRGNQFIVITAAIALIGSLLVLYFSDWTGGISGIRLPRESFNLGFSDLTFLQREVAYWINLGFLIAVMILMSLLVRTPLGLAFKLVRENETKAELIGYQTKWLKGLSFTLSGSLASLAGALTALTQGSMDSTLFNWTHSIDGLAWVVIGGAGTLFGPLLGMGILQAIDRYLADLIPISSTLLSGILLILFVILAPKGISGLAKKFFGRST